MPPKHAGAFDEKKWKNTTGLESTWDKFTVQLNKAGLIPSLNRPPWSTSVSDLRASPHAAQEAITALYNLFRAHSRTAIEREVGISNSDEMEYYVIPHLIMAVHPGDITMAKLTAKSLVQVSPSNDLHELYIWMKDGSKPKQVRNTGQKKSGTMPTGPKRHAPAKLSASRGINKAAIRRLAKRAGVKRISGLMYEESRSLISNFVTGLVKDAIIYCEHGKRSTVSASDVIHALKKRGTQLYGYT